jgi:hypothetical protein
MGQTRTSFKNSVLKIEIKKRPLVHQGSLNAASATSDYA